MQAIRDDEMAAMTAEQLRQLADRVRRLVPDHRNPHRFHEEKSDIEHELRQLARGRR